MPLNAFGWSSEEDELLAELVQPHSHLYNVQDPSRKNILAREATWQKIAEQIHKPVEECKKRWRGIRDGYMRNKRMGSIHKTKIGIFEKLQFLDGAPMEGSEELMEMGNSEETTEIEDKDDTLADAGCRLLGVEQVNLDNQDYYEITVLDGPAEQDKAPYIQIIPKPMEEPKKIIKRPAGRRKNLPIPKMPPIKILPKPIVLQNGPNIVRCIEDPKKPEQRSETIDKLIEKMLKENTNEIDVFFRSMAASVKKLQPNLIPKVKMEVCNVIAKYEMQSFETTMNING